VNGCGSAFLAGFRATAADDIDRIDIRVLPEAIVYEEFYTLGDIAELDGFDVETIQELAKTQVGKSPLPGKSHLLSAAQINTRLKTQFSKHKLNLVMPKQAMVSRASIKITAKELEKIVLDEVQKHYSGYKDARFHIRTKLRDVFIPKGEASYAINRIGDSLKVGGYSSWMLQLKLDGKEVKKILVRMKVDVFDDVVVAKDTIPKGTLIAEDDLQTVKKDISREHKGYTSEPDLVVGEHARRDIYKNEALDDQLVEKPVIVVKGDHLQVVYRTRNLYLTNLAMAMRSGRKGDTIPLRTLKSKKTIYAVITDAKVAEIAL